MAIHQTESKDIRNSNSDRISASVLIYQENARMIFLKQANNSDKPKQDSK